ncbi:hypothetical protein [Methanosarcina horonobensis]|nr:hypothetical protein [Methanosarcina horonobensis]
MRLIEEISQDIIKKIIKAEFPKRRVFLPFISKGYITTENNSKVVFGDD